MSISLLGLEFDGVALARAASRIADRPATAGFGYVVTPNADHLVRMACDPKLRAIYQQASMCLLDSRVVACLARLLGLAAPPVVTGSDLTAYLLAHCIPPGERVTIIGLSAAFLPALVARYNLLPPAHHVPPMGFDADPAAMAQAVAFVRAHPSRFVFLAVGSPRQEYLAAALAAAGNVTGTGLCIGASLEFLAGARRRAPGFLQHLCLEWLFRLINEPARLGRRYLVRSPAVIGLLLKQRLGGRALR